MRRIFWPSDLHGFHRPRRDYSKNARSCRTGVLSLDMWMNLKAALLDKPTERETCKGTSYEEQHYGFTIHGIVSQFQPRGQTNSRNHRQGFASVAAAAAAAAAAASRH